MVPGHISMDLSRLASAVSSASLNLSVEVSQSVLQAAPSQSLAAVQRIVFSQKQWSTNTIVAVTSRRLAGHDWGRRREVRAFAARACACAEPRAPRTNALSSRRRVGPVMGTPVGAPACATPLRSAPRRWAAPAVSWRASTA
eukprot:98634-Chlamydomonas_euryale.AAC.8